MDAYYRNVLDVPHPSTCLISGATNSGKSTLLKQIVRVNARKYHRIILVCPTAFSRANAEYRRIFRPEQMVETIEEGYFEALLEELREISERKAGRYRTLLILDDVIGRMKKDDTAMQIVATAHRQYNLSCIILTQYVNKISPAFRDNVSVVFVTKLKRNQIKQLFEFTGCLESEKELLLFLNENCVLHQQAVRINMEDTDNPVLFVPPAPGYKEFTFREE